MNSYLIQGANGSLKYWVRITDSPMCGMSLDWMGLIENATHFKARWQAEAKISTARATTMMKVEIIEYKKEEIIS